MSFKPIAASLKASKPTLSFEFFPPKDEEGVKVLWQSFDKLAESNPNFVSVTYGAMGSNQEASLQVVEKFAPVIPTIAHLTCIGASEQSISNLLLRYIDFGVSGLLALRGDVPAGQQAPSGDFRHAIDLVEFSRDHSDLEIGVAAFPEKHPESDSLTQDAQILLQKAEAGASYAMTQMFFKANAYFDLVRRTKDIGVSFPIVPGLMPISNAKQVLRMAEMSGAEVPNGLVKELLAAKDEVESRSIGMRFSAELAQELLVGGAPGIHIFTLNQSRSALELAQEIGLG